MLLYQGNEVPITRKKCIELISACVRPNFAVIRPPKRKFVSTQKRKQIREALN